MGYVKGDGDAARECRELFEPLGGLYDVPRADRGADPPEPPRRRSLLPAGPDHSLSVAAEPTDSSTSPALLWPALAEPEPDTKLMDDEFALEFFSVSLSLFS